MKVNTTIRLDEILKNEASQLAKKLGTNLSNILNMYLTSFVKEKKIHFEIRDEAGFTKKSGEDLLKIGEDAKKGIGISGTYSNMKDLINSLD